ncbi:hypothetical protein K450DRAFT_298135 [Umbelopsis ramanniana AG]|uniref:Uncharacterized protein n=1 Tax=Umbelopsis ramanniana AG TaxID=1314678 RepID=A0AAD5EEY0_UMBRA|nr:uncharacterized protein K450DRAFT_298135 [Umbelopsis ramanniana AG]KAI8582102.1 hypothetical protein K450DRAFT_298135 [Umbelopsis ramanniana AG]
MSFNNNHTRKTVLITGASDGLGLEAAKNYAKAEFTTVMAGRSAEKLAKAAEAVRIAANIDASQADEKIHTICFDFSSLESVRNGVNQFLDLNLPLNLLINNAGMFGRSREFTKDSNVFEKTLMVNMVGPLLFTELLLPRMMESGGGNIIIVSSSLHFPKKNSKKLILPLDNLDGSKAWSSEGSYAASKLADLWWAYVLADKLSKSDPKIRVNALDPGAVPSTGIAREAPWIIQKVLPYILPLITSNTVTLETAGEHYLGYGIDPQYASDNGIYYDRGNKVKSSEESYDMVKAKTVYNLACQVTGLDDRKVAV